MSDEGKPVRMAFSVTHARVQHYDDVVDYMAKDAIDKYRKEYGREPTAQQVAFLKKELVRYAVIRHDVAKASTIKINPSNILNEAHCLHSRVQLHR
jgi:predicted nucleic acid-binding OB-fold protein